MQYDFLNNFPKRMKHVGMYVLLIQNSIQKTTWKQYGFLKADEQINMIFTVMLYIMEQSLKEDNCTLDDIGVFIDTINMQHLNKKLSYDECRQLGDFIVNIILSNEGKAMYFDSFDYETNTYNITNISYVANKIIYVDGELKRTSYYLTDDGYNLVLSTLEIENNMKLTIHEMIFQMHLEKQRYDKAVDDIKNVFNLMRIQLQKIQEAISQIRRNALNYSVKDYREILEENLETISDTKQKFNSYRDMVKSRAKELEEENINVRRLDEKDEENLNNLREIERYLNKTIDEHQRILSSHFDLKMAYTDELEALSQMSMISRFSISRELYEKVLENPGALDDMDYFLRPLFNRDIEKVYNINKAFELQKTVKKKDEEDSVELVDFDEDDWYEQREKEKMEKLKRYEKSLSYILENADCESGTTLGKIKENAENAGMTETLIPTLEIFREIMIELIKNQVVDVFELKKERSEHIRDTSLDFQMNEMILQILDKLPQSENVARVETYRTNNDEKIMFENVMSEDGRRKNIICSNVKIRLIRRLDYGV